LSLLGSVVQATISERGQQFTERLYDGLWILRIFVWENENDFTPSVAHTGCKVDVISLLVRSEHDVRVMGGHVECTELLNVGKVCVQKVPGLMARPTCKPYSANVENIVN